MKINHNPDTQEYDFKVSESEAHTLILGLKALSANNYYPERRNNANALLEIVKRRIGI